MASWMSYAMPPEMDKVESKSSADKGLITHQTRHCKESAKDHPDWLVKKAANGG